MRRVPRAGSEEDLQDQVLRYLEIVSECLAFEYYNSAVYSRGKRKFLKKDQRWRPDGIPDIVLAYRGLKAWIELKREVYRTKKNGGLSDAQVAMHVKMKAAGWRVTTCYSLEDVRSYLKKLDAEIEGGTDGGRER